MVMNRFLIFVSILQILMKNICYSLMISSISRKAFRFPASIFHYLKQKDMQSEIHINENINFNDNDYNLIIKGNHTSSSSLDLNCFDVKVSIPESTATINEPNKDINELNDITNMLSNFINESYDIAVSPHKYPTSHYELVDWVTLSDTDIQSIMTLTRKTIYKYNLLHRGIGIIVMNNLGEIYIHQRASTKKVFPSMLDMFIGGVMNSNDRSTDFTMLRELKEELGLDLGSYVTPSTNNNNISYNNYSSNSDIGIYDNSDDMVPILDFKNINQGSSSTSTINSISSFCQYAQSLKYNPAANTNTNIDHSKTVSNNNKNNNKNNNNNELVPFQLFRLGKSICCTSYNHCIVDCYIVILNNQQLINSIQFVDGEIEWGKWIGLVELQKMVEIEKTRFVPDGLQVWDDMSRLFNRK